MAEKTIEGFIQALMEIKPEWEAMRTNDKLRFEAEAEWAIQAFTKNDTAIKYTMGNTEAAFNALRNVAAIGVTLDPARKFAYILPRDGKMVYDLSYQGLMEIAISSGSLQWGQARRVHENDVFELAGYDEPPVHKFSPFAKPEARGPVVGCYVVVKTAQGDYLTSTMTIEEIHAIRARSTSYKAYLANNSKLCPWNTDAKKMELKTVVKDAYPYWPRTERLDKAIHYLNTDGGQGVDLAGDDSTGKFLLEALLKDLAACKDGPAVVKCWTEGRVKLAEFPDETAKLRDAVVKRNHELGVVPPAKTNGTPATTSAPTASPTPAPTAAPAGPRTYAQVVDIINKCETDAELEATGPMIDALPPDQQVKPNEFYNTRLRYLNKKFGRPEQ